ncbi:hypothetical protein ccbrp13_62210 [Ktedonobacteria bacterium brp13]|nr:hypothetical protein ccbrp13_62210 [Ktedonobacteria bacterium brp13]
MAHIFVGVIVPGSTAFENVEDTVKRQLEPFGDDWKVEPYKVYLDKEEISNIAKDHNISQKELEKWYGRPLALDERGSYYSSTYNSQAKWDYWCIGGSWDGVASKMSRHNNDYRADIELGHCSLKGNMIRIAQVETIPQFFALVTPDIHWYEIGSEGVKLECGEQDRSEWEIKTQQIIETHRNDILVGIDCHS